MGEGIKRAIAAAKATRGIRKPRPLKVYGGMDYLSVHGQVRVFAAATSLSAFAKKVGMSAHHAKGFACETGVEKELLIAMAQPDKVFFWPRESDGHKAAEPKELIRGEVTNVD